MGKHATPSDVKKVLERTTMEMIATYRGSDTLGAKWISEEYDDRKSKVAKRLNKKPIYDQIKKKWAAADRGMFFEEVHYTREEEKFINSDADYLEQQALYKSEWEELKEEEKAFLNRMKKGKLPPDEQDIYDNAEISVRMTKRTKENEWKVAEILFDSVFYEAMNYEDSTPWDCRFDYRLSRLGCYREPHDYSRQDVYCDREKEVARGYKEKFLGLHPYCEEYLKGVR